MDKNAELNLEKVKSNVQQKFNEIRAALHMREKLLLRQLEVIANTQRQQQMLKSGRQQQEVEEGNGPSSAPSSPAKGEVRFVVEEEELLTAIRSYGRFQLDNMQLALQDVYLRNEDYIAPAADHETMYKCLPDGQIAYYDLDEDAQPEAIVVDFSRNKSLVEDSAKLMNKSIINITLQEAKELIRKAKIKRETHVPPLNLEELDDELESSIAEAVSSLGGNCLEPPPPQPPNNNNNNNSSSHNNKSKSRKPRFKPKITINNCNGTINLRNIASLTINCANEEAVSAEIPVASAPNGGKLQQSADSSTTTDQSTPNTTASSSNYSSNASSRSQSKKQKGSKKTPGPKKEQPRILSSTTSTSQPTSMTSYGNITVDEETDTHDVTCDFYNRLLNEIKKSLKEKPIRTYDNHLVQAAAADSTCDANSNAQLSTSNSTALSPHIQPGKRLILKNFENLKIILEANSGDEDSFHPVQIEQWLAEIISETDLEPMQNTEILEHSKITNSESN